MGRKLNLLGQKFGRWEVIGEAKPRRKMSYWLCRCECGNEREVVGADLKRGMSESCGCLNADKNSESRTTHGLSRHRFYHTWLNMLDRCCDSSCPNYENYGKRGISVCEEWYRDPTAFLAWCDSQEPEEGHSLDRINNEGNYEPSNCRFVNKVTQSRNRRDNVLVDYNGEKLCLMEFFQKYSVVSYDTMDRRVKSGMGYIEAAMTPCSERRRDSLGKYII